jgi:hypothetical protein
MNVALDAHFMGAQPGHQTTVNNALGFLKKAKDNNCYTQVHAYGGDQN